MRCRFAPSPTGHLHLGGLRTALVNWLAAKKMNGSFIVRLEDTDMSRLVPGADVSLLNTLEQFGLRPKESYVTGGPFGPYRQSERLIFYAERSNELLDRKLAYRCFCTENRLNLIRRDALRRRLPPKYDNRCRTVSKSESDSRMRNKEPYVIRFKMENEPNSFEDLVYGTVHEMPTKSEGDPIIIKSDGFPTYHFANVCDDHYMKISHVFRGAEWLVSTVKHIQLYSSFGWHPPKFAHLPLLVDSKGRKLSKRMGPVDVKSYDRLGYLPNAVLNFVSQMGAGLPGSNETPNSLLTLEEMASQFDISLIGKAPIVVDRHFLRNVSLISLRNADFDREILPRLERILAENLQADSLDAAYTRRIWSYLMRDSRIECLSDICAPDFAWLWRKPDFGGKNAFENVCRDLIQMRKKGVKCDEMQLARQFLCECIQILSEHDDNKMSIHFSESVKNLARDFSIKYGRSMQFLRYSLLGNKTGPPLREIISLIGKEESLERFENAVQILSSLDQNESDFLHMKNLLT